MLLLFEGEGSRAPVTVERGEMAAKVRETRESVPPSAAPAQRAGATDSPAAAGPSSSRRLDVMSLRLRGSLVRDASFQHRLRGFATQRGERWCSFGRRPTALEPQAVLALTVVTGLVFLVLLVVVGMNRGSAPSLPEDTRGEDGAREGPERPGFEHEGDVNRAAESPLQVPTEESTLTREALRNAEYESDFGTTVPLKDGQFSIVRDPRWATERDTWWLDDAIAFGDLDADGIADAVTALTYNGGGTGHFKSLVVVLNDKGQPAHVASHFLGDRISINALEIENGVITLEVNTHGPGDGLCCPSVHTVARFRVVGGASDGRGSGPSARRYALEQISREVDLDN